MNPLRLLLSTIQTFEDEIITIITLLFICFGAYKLYGYVVQTIINCNNVATKVGVSADSLSLVKDTIRMEIKNSTLAFSQEIRTTTEAIREDMLIQAEAMRADFMSQTNEAKEKAGRAIHMVEDAVHIIQTDVSNAAKSVSHAGNSISMLGRVGIEIQSFWFVTQVVVACYGLVRFLYTRMITKPAIEKAKSENKYESIENLKEHDVLKAFDVIALAAVVPMFIANGPKAGMTMWYWLKHFCVAIKLACSGFHLVKDLFHTEENPIFGNDSVDELHTVVEEFSERVSAGTASAINAAAEQDRALEDLKNCKPQAGFDVKCKHFPEVHGHCESCMFQGEGDESEQKQTILESEEKKNPVLFMHQYTSVDGVLQFKTPEKYVKVPYDALENNPGVQGLGYIPTEEEKTQPIRPPGLTDHQKRVLKNKFPTSHGVQHAKKEKETYSRGFLDPLKEFVHKDAKGKIEDIEFQVSQKPWLLPIVFLVLGALLVLLSRKIDKMRKSVKKEVLEIKKDVVLETAIITNKTLNANAKVFEVKNNDTEMVYYPFDGILNPNVVYERKSSTAYKKRVGNNGKQLSGLFISSGGDVSGDEQGLVDSDVEGNLSRRDRMARDRGLAYGHGSKRDMAETDKFIEEATFDEIREDLLNSQVEIQDNMSKMIFESEFNQPKKFVSESEKISLPLKSRTQPFMTQLLEASSQAREQKQKQTTESLNISVENQVPVKKTEMVKIKSEYEEKYPTKTPEKGSLKLVSANSFEAIAESDFAAEIKAKENKINDIVKAPITKKPKNHVAKKASSLKKKSAYQIARDSKRAADNKRNIAQQKYESDCGVGSFNTSQAHKCIGWASVDSVQDGVPVSGGTNCSFMWNGIYVNEHLFGKNATDDTDITIHYRGKGTIATPLTFKRAQFDVVSDDLLFMRLKGPEWGLNKQYMHAAEYNPKHVNVLKAGMPIQIVTYNSLDDYMKNIYVNSSGIIEKVENDRVVAKYSSKEGNCGSPMLTLTGFCAGIHNIGMGDRNSFVPITKNVAIACGQKPNF